MDKRKAFAIAAACVALFGLIFVAVGGGVFAGLALPEMRDQNIARNDAYSVEVAVITREVRSSTMVNGEWRYRLAFSWGDNLHGQTAPVYSHQQAVALVGDVLIIRVNDSGRAVPVDFQTSARSTVGWVFLPVFGGIGLVALLVAGGLLIARGKQEQDSLAWMSN